MKLLFVFISFISIFFADSLDLINDKVVTKMISYSKFIDQTLSSEKIRGEFTQLFEDDDFYYMNNKTCLKIKLGYHYHEYATDEFIQKIRLKLDLPLLKHSFKFFIDGDYLDDELNPNYKENTSIGIESDFAQSFDSKLRLGISGFDDIYLRYRVGLSKRYDKIFVEPYQYFRYSIHDEFFESSNINIDRIYNSNNFARVHIYRASKNTLDEKSYGISLSHTLLFDDKSLLFLLSRNIISKTNTSFSNKYLISSHWKQNIFKKFFFLDINPYILFQNSENYHASIGIKALFEWRFER